MWKILDCLSIFIFDMCEHLFHFQKVQPLTPQIRIQIMNISGTIF